MSRIVTFYSYKGGVGRTSALANVAVLLSRLGRKVLAIDWDLEAPGLDQYFDDMQHSKDGPSEGLVHLLIDSAKSGPVKWRPYSTEVEIPDGLPLTLIASGRQMPGYDEAMREFSWGDFFSKQRGGEILNAYREEWKSEFDFVLIDSRTGITDSGGVCTVFMPDIMVLVFTANSQSFDGGLLVANGVQTARRQLQVSRPPLAILPLPGRFDGRDEVDDADAWLARFSKDLKPYYDDWLPKQFSPRRILELTKIPYVSKFSFGETLAVLTHGITDPEFPGYYLNNVARLLATDFADAARMLAPSEAPQSLLNAVRQEISSGQFDTESVERRINHLAMLLGDGAKLCEFFGDIGPLLMSSGEFDLGAKLLQRATDIATTVLPPESPLILRTLEILRENSGHLETEELETIHRDYIARLNKQVPISEALLARAHEGLGDILSDEYRVSSAADEYSLALQAMRAIGRPADAPLIALLEKLGVAKRLLGQLDEAENIHREALGLVRQSGRSDDNQMLSIINNLASTLRDRGNFEEAELFYRDALERIRKRPGVAGVVLISALNNLANVLQEMGNLTEAENLYVEELNLLRSSTERPNRSSLTRVYHRLAEVYRAKGDLAAAEASYRHLLAELRGTARPGDANFVRTANSLASLLAEKGDISAAEDLYREALQKSFQTRAGSATIESFGKLIDIIINRDGETAAKRLVENHPATVARIFASPGKEAQPIKVILERLGFSPDQMRPDDRSESPTLF
jgi:MinD-like ATPase involved in chromosome partitioning or flagellar assembly/tetratricopeptide (TPR) repeat protein